MLYLTIYFLMATSVYAEDYEDFKPKPFPVLINQKQTIPRPPSIIPRDNNDDTYTKDFRDKLNSNIFHRFEQIKKEKSPQNEVKYENVGKYQNGNMETPKPTQASLKKSANNNIRLFRTSRKKNDYEPPTHTKDSNQDPLHSNPLTCPPLPPHLPTLNYSDFSEYYKGLKLPEIPSKEEKYYNEAPKSLTTSHHRPSYQPQHMAAIPEANLPNSPNTEVEPIDPLFSLHPVLLYLGSILDRIAAIPPEHKKNNHKFENEFPPPLPNTMPEKNMGNQWNQEFNWNNIVSKEPKQTTSLPDYQTPPPPAPTLTPWIDGYGT